jgi:hypothetical protein
MMMMMFVLLLFLYFSLETENDKMLLFVCYPLPVLYFSE